MSEAARLMGCAVVAMLSLGFEAVAAGPLDTTPDVLLGQAGFQYTRPNRVGLDGFDSPGAVVLDERGPPAHLYVADVGNNRVLAWLDSEAAATGAPADLVIGQPHGNSYECNAGGLSAASLCNPGKMAVDHEGHLYVSDQGNQRVLRYDSPLADQSDGIADASRERIEARGLEVDAVGDLFLTGLEGDPTDPNGPRDSVVLVFRTPWTLDAVPDVTFNGGLSGMFGNVKEDFHGNLWLALGGDNLCRFDERPLPDVYASRRDCTDFGTTDLSVAPGPEATLFVSHGSNDLKFFPTGQVDDLGQDGQGQFFPSCPHRWTDGSPLCSFGGIAMDQDARLFAAESTQHSVFRYDAAADGDATIHATLGNAGTDGRRNRVGFDGMDSPTSVAIDRSVSPNRVWVLDAGNGRALGWQEQPTAVRHGDAASVAIDLPDGANALAVGASGNLYVSHAAGVSIVLDPFEPGASDGPAIAIANALGLVVDSSGALWVATSDRVLRIDDPLGGASVSWAAARCTTCTDARPVTDPGFAPEALALGADGTLFVVSGDRLLAIRPGSMDLPVVLVETVARNEDPEQPSVLASNDAGMGSVAVAPDGVVFVSFGSAAIELGTGAGPFLFGQRAFGTGSRLTGLAFDDAGSLWAAQPDRHAVIAYR